MIVLTWLAWAATAVCLITYVRMQRGHSPAVFDWANVAGCIPLVIMDYLVGATPAAVISLAFGIAGAHGRIAAWHERRALKRWVEAKHTDTEIKQWLHDEVAQHEADLATVAGLSDISRGRVAGLQQAVAYLERSADGKG